MFYGFDSIQWMCKYLDENYQKEIKYTKCGKEIEVKKKMYFYAHNGKGFDSFMILNDSYLWNWLNEFRYDFKQIVKTNAGIL